MRQNQTSEAQQKNEKFKNQIRNRIKNDHMRKIRDQFLRLQLLESYKQNKQKFTLSNLQYFVNQPASGANLAMMNRILIDRRYQINYELFKKLLTFVKNNFLNQQLVALTKKYELKDFIAFFSNLLACQSFIQISLNQLNFSQIVDNLIFLVEHTEKQTGSLILWLLFRIVSISPQNTVIKIANVQLQLKQKIGLTNINLSYLLNLISDTNQNLIKPQIIDGLTLVQINSKTETYYCQNIISIFDKFLFLNKQLMFTQLILDWVTIQLLSRQFPPLAKLFIFQLLLNMIKGNFELTTITNFISHGITIVQLVCRSLYDCGFENKKVCLTCLIQLIKKCPKLQLEMLISSYPSVMEAIVSSFSLMDIQITLESLKALTLIAVKCHENNQIKQIIYNHGAKEQIQILTLCQDQNIVQLANGMLQYLEN